MTLKMAVLAPMPSASVMIAIAVNPGDFRSCRRANFRSFMLFSAQSDDWIDARSAAKTEKRKLNSRCAPHVSRTRSFIGRGSKTGSEESIDVTAPRIDRSSKAEAILDLTKSVRLVRWAWPNEQ